MTRQDLSVLDRDMFQGPLRLIQEAMAHGITNDMIFGGLEPGQTAIQGIHALPVAVQNCRIGTRRVTWDGEVFKYGRAISTLNTDLLAQSNSHIQAVAYAEVQATALAGATELSVTVGGSDGDGSGNITANALAYGKIIIFPHSENSLNMTIIGNTAVSGGGAMTVTLAEPLPIAITASTMHVEIMANQYIAIKAGTAGDLHKSFIGLPQMPATALLPFHWEQTWGGCWVAPDNGWSSVDVGNTRENHQVVARYNGSIAVHDYNDTENKFQQHVGFVLSRVRANTQGAPFIMLQISQ